MASFVNRRTLSGEDFLSFFSSFPSDPSDCRCNCTACFSYCGCHDLGCTSQDEMVRTAWSLAGPNGCAAILLGALEVNTFQAAALQKTGSRSTERVLGG